MAKYTVKEISTAGLIAAVYTILGFAFQPISFGVYQVRIAEALTVLPYLTRAAIPGLFIGTILTNVLGGMGWVDIVFGPLITLAAAILTRQIRLLPSGKLSVFIAAIPTFLMWASGAYLLTGLKVDSSTQLGAILSLFAMAILTIPNMNRIVSWTIGLIITAGAVWLMMTTTEPHFIILGIALLLAALVTYSMLLGVIRGGDSPNMLIAPLPPVILNALGVSVYLAPMLGFNYWFAVQMLGLGQLIACYLIGLPLLKLLFKRKIFI